MSNNGRGTMIRKAVLALMFLALAIAVGCSSIAQSPVLPAVTAVTVTPLTPAAFSAAINTSFGSPLSVTVTSNGTPVSGQIVTFSVLPSEGAGGTFPNGTTSTSATTDAEGVATSAALNANGTAGTYNVAATMASSTSSALFYMTNTP